MSLTTDHSKTISRKAAGRRSSFHRPALTLGMVSAMFGMAVTQAEAAKTGTWTLVSPHNSNTSNGITVAMSSSSPFSTIVAGTMAGTNFWLDPFAAVPTSSIPNSADIDIITQPVASQTVTVTFSKAVDNPVLHIDRLGGSVGGLTNSSNWQLVGSNLATLPALVRLAGNQQFRVVGNAFFRPEGATYSTTGCSVASATALSDDGSNACGSVQFSGTGITSLTFTVTYLGGAGIGDGLEMVWSTGGSRIAVAKQSTFGTRVFTFSGTNGVSSVSLDTTLANPASSSFFNVLDHRQPFTITEGSVSDYVLTGANCIDQNLAAVPSTLSGLTLTVDAANFRANQDIICTFSNRRTPAVDLRISKSDGVATAFSGSNLTYSVIVTNDGPDAISGAVVRDIPGAGITCLPGSPVTITGSGVPGGSFTISDLIGAGITLGTLANGQSATLTYSCRVN